MDRRWPVAVWMRGARQQKWAAAGGAAHVDQAAHVLVLAVAALTLTALSLNAPPKELQHKTGGRGLKGLPYEARVDLLVMVGQKTPPDEPLWSVLLIAHGDQEALAMHRAVAIQLGRDVPEDDGELVAQLKDQRAELQRFHR
ncbi:hypothetical protein [Streptomyces sp. NPDC057689]|uniref:hypothetical protein n=1 Tax=Streptomyces sp. NPDC057689 TaxID=3346213 RepID=UPI00368BAAFD